MIIEEQHNWLAHETGTHQDHVIAHVVGATVLGYFTANEAAQLLLDIGFIWTDYLDGEMGLVPQVMAIAELELDEEEKSSLREDARQLQDAVAQACDATPDDAIVHAFIATSNKLVLADSYIAALATALDDATPPSAVAASLDLELFRQDAPRGIGLLLRQFRWHAPALRYAIRLSLAMTTWQPLECRSLNV